MTWIVMAVFIFGVGFGAMMAAWWLTGRDDRAGHAEAKAIRTHPVYRQPTRLEQVNRLALLDDALAVAERQAGQREVEREVAAMWAEVEANPERWRS